MLGIMACAQTCPRSLTAHIVQQLSCISQHFDALGACKQPLRVRTSPVYKDCSPSSVVVSPQADSSLLHYAPYLHDTNIQFNTKQSHMKRAFLPHLHRHLL